MRPCPHIPKLSFFPLSCSLSFQEYLRPNGSTEIDSKCYSSYTTMTLGDLKGAIKQIKCIIIITRPIGGA